MKNLKFLFCAVLVMVLVVSPCVNAATVEDIISYAKQEHVIAGVATTLSDADVARIEHFFSENAITAEQGDIILNKVKEAIKVTNDASTTGLKNMSADAKKEVLALLNEAGSQVNVTLSYTPSDKTVKVYHNGELFDTVDLSGKLPFTGVNVIPYIAVSLIVVAAIAVFAVSKKGKLVNAK